MSASPAVQLQALADALGGREIERDSAWISFRTDHATFEANIKDGARQMRIRAYLQIGEAVDPVAWVRRQPEPLSGTLQDFEYSDSTLGIRLVFERNLCTNVWANDPIQSEVREYATALAENSDVSENAGNAEFRVEGDPRAEAPASAWLLTGDAASYPNPLELSQAQIGGDVGIFDYLWTAAKQTQVGDLVLLYFMAPDKAAHFVARAASDAFFSRDFEVNARTEVANEQRWAYLTPPIQIEPLPFGLLQAACGGHLILRGRSGKYLRPEVVDALTFKATDPDQQAEVDRIVVRPVGRADLPHPLDIELSQWRTIAAGALPLEAHVESHIVEPLLRMITPDGQAKWKRQHRLRSGVVDFLVTRKGVPVAAVEAKLAMPNPITGDWSTTAEFRQLRRYIDELQVPGLLIDAHRVLLVEPMAPNHSDEIIRRHALESDIQRVGRRILGGRTAR